MEPQMSELSTPEDILDAARMKEREAYEFYSGLLTRPHARLVRDLLEHLKDEEYKHFRSVEDMLAKLHLGHNLLR